jgi:site-specific recombinase XerD
MDYSESYKKDLRRTLRLWDNYLGRKGIKQQPANTLTTDVVADFVFTSAASPQSKSNLKRNISALLKDELETVGVILNLRKIKLPKKAQELHRPINDVPALLHDIKQYNGNLYLCCLMTYSMLLRPHREIRCLRFSDFNTDFTVLSLDGSRVKSKRNRILPVPPVVRAEIVSRFETVEDRNVNLFSLDKHEYNPSYFKGIWSKYKRQSKLLSDKQTLYYFRHSGSIKVFEKTGSLLKLQQVMGHSSMTVSLSYLRGLAVKQLDIQDLPTVQ